MTTDITELAQSLKAAAENGCCHTLFPDDCLALVEALEKAQRRISRLESRTVKLPAERFCPAEYAGSQLWSETEVWNKAITACADELRAAGIKVEAE
ncbi:hypothetical protein ACP6PD_11170 [Klebsiella pneumoniae]|uniref:hypothetical protein n=1 Tax=Klebsiella pneumoniae TaxID=573 RepID=UPI003B59F486